MTLVNRITIAPLSGTPIGLHGGRGQIHGRGTTGERFRRPGGTSAGYQTMGRDVEPSELIVWHAFATAAEGKALAALLEELPYKVVKVTYKEHTAVRCVITSVRIDRLIACKGSIITGSTAARWRLEATIALEYAP